MTSLWDEAQRRYNHDIPREIRDEQRTGKTTLEIQIARADAYLARCEIELARARPAAKQAVRDTIAKWTEHKEALLADQAMVGRHEAAE